MTVSRGIGDVERSDAALVYRALQRGEASVVDLAEMCFPLTFGTADPLYERLIKRSVTRVLASIDWMRGQGVAVTCLSKPGSRSMFVLGHIEQGPESYAAYRRSIVSLEAEEPSDPMAIWHGEA